ncbi:DUF975 family protein [Fructobacillus sp. M1-13]|uniref:DUF975 family protein n=1 Tax=Fructobacillus papyriferae TaxID=2713171 RepID=A0ABS5QPP5_9LACO|nr:DUF975 family protein [Fructobacillus papyriferae]MBS9335070.1 DUF975 family protein [Fructobacillus papyriferae]MCD2159444.1 DUF975 family protein [Fructobacillus papyriferae]
MTKREVRRQIKAKAKEQLANNWIYLVLVTLPAVLFGWIGDRSFQVVDTFAIMNGDFPWVDGTGTYLSIGDGTAMGILAFFAGTAAMYSLLNFMRFEEKQSHPFLQAIEVYREKGLFLGTIGIAILQFVWTFLWTLLFFIPGVIKSFSYSQAFYVYKDAKADGESIRFRDAITRSRQLMVGHKWEYFVLQLSFIGWLILANMVMGIGMIILLPYMYLTYAGFYDYLKEDAAQQEVAD